uniref:Secreted frizzled-related protein 1 n=1 Tax=Ditylenchus dipsaci TaxID=166011 RepID=A0A915ERM0_9BILA
MADPKWLKLTTTSLFLVTSMCLCPATGYLAEWSNMFSSSMSSSSVDRPNTPKCIDIPQNLSLCHGMQYSSMRLPNLLDHDTLDEVIQQSDAWISLLRLHCHADTKLFLCSLFAPVCLPNLDKHIHPCRSLCDSVKQGCESRMQQYGFPWPDMLRCDRFPTDNDMCIKPVVQAQTKTACKSCTQVATFENLMDNFCRSTIVLKGRLRSLNDSHITIRKSRSFKGDPGSATPRAHRSPPVPAVDQAIRLSENSLDSEDKRCPCPMERGGNNFLVMATEKRVASGNSEGGSRELVARLIMPWKHDKAFKGAIRKFRKVNCNTLGREIRESVLRQTFKRTVY